MTAILMFISALTYQPVPPTSAEIAQAAEHLDQLVATAMEGATRGTAVQVVETLPPPPPEPEGPPAFSDESSNGRCVGAEPLLAYYSPGWSVTRMAGIAYRESRCDTNARNSCCSSLLQIHRQHIPHLGHCGVYSRDDLYDPSKNVCAAAWLWEQAGYQPWSQTS